MYGKITWGEIIFKGGVYNKSKSKNFQVIGGRLYAANI